MRRTTKNATTLPARWPSGRRGPYSTWWLLAKDGAPLADVLTVGVAGGRMLPTFSHEDEAQMFLWFGGGLEDGWRVRETSAGELASLLSGPCADVGGVALDPLPGMAEAGTIDLVRVDRVRFLCRIVANGGRGVEGTRRSPESRGPRVRRPGRRPS